MLGPVRAATATWRPTGPKTRPFRLGLGAGSGERDPPLLPGAVVGRYRILGTLGEGGMGRVYDAEALEPGGGRAALKILRRDRNPAGDDIARFRQEAKAAARVGHPSIVQVIELGELPDHTLYMAMERLFGQSFEDWLEAPGRLRDGLGWLAEVARGLHAAHAAGVLHRDVKPANLFLHVDPRDPHGRPRGKILDFGIAKVVTADVTHIETQAGTLLGTPYYLAPERALGRSLDARADLYSLGVILYEVLTGLVPFEDESFMGILAQHIRAQPLDPRQAAPDRVLPPGVCLLTMRLLAKDPQDRPPHGNAVADELEALLRHEAAEIDAVVTGPRQAMAAGDETVQLHDVAERPTAAPTESRSGVAHGSMVAGAAVSSAAGSIGGGRPARPTRPAPRWPLWLAGAVGVGVLGGAASWGVLGARAEVEAPAAPLAEEIEEIMVEPAADPMVEPAPVAEADPTPPPDPMPPDPPPGPAAAVSPSPEPSADPPPAASTGVQDPVPPAPAPSRRDGDRTKTRRPRPRPDAPPPPDFKD